MRKAGVPSSVHDEVLAAYPRLGADVAVRSSATVETSLAGRHETYANVVGDAAVSCSDPG